MFPDFTFDVSACIAKCLIKSLLGWRNETWTLPSFCLFLWMEFLSRLLCPSFLPIWELLPKHSLSLEKPSTLSPSANVFKYTHSWGVTVVWNLVVLLFQPLSKEKRSKEGINDLKSLSVGSVETVENTYLLSVRFRWDCFPALDPKGRARQQICFCWFCQRIHTSLSQRQVLFQS